MLLYTVNATDDWYAPLTLQKYTPLRAGWAESPALAGERSQILDTTFFAPYPRKAVVGFASLRILTDNFIGDGTPVSVALYKTLIIDIPELFIIGIQHLRKGYLPRLPGSVFVRVNTESAHHSPPGEGGGARQSIFLSSTFPAMIRVIRITAKYVFMPGSPLFFQNIYGCIPVESNSVLYSSVSSVRYDIQDHPGERW